MGDEIKYAVPQDKLTDVLLAAFNLSGPQGMGYLHYQPGNASEEHRKFFQEEVDRAIAAEPDEPYFKGIHLDYVQGRACKFSIRYDLSGWYVEGPRWFDHSPQQLLELVKSCGLEPRATAAA